ncbi:MAG TPA: histidine kinase, partial [Polaribacter sp.]|nr:histidine kinase [Polaribacter sp.]
MNSSSGIAKIKFKEGVIVSLKMTLIFALLFTLINQNFALKVIGYTLLISAMYSFGLGLIQGIINDSLNNKWDWIEHTNTRIWAGIVSTVLYTVPAVLLIDYVNFIVISGQNINRFFSGRFLWMHVFYIILSFGISAFLHARGFMIQWKNSVKQESTKQEIVAKTETAKFESLKNQLDPHFLFNSLNVLTSLIGENPQQAERFTTKLSKVYRYVLEQRNKDLVPIEEELKFAKTYMELLGMRFEEAVQFNIPDTISNNELKIVPLS